MNDHLLRFNFSQKILFWDCETENLSLGDSSIHKNRPWQSGFILCQGKKTLLEKQENIWWPDLNISEEAAKITRFDRLDYEQTARDPKEVWDEFAQYFYDPSVLIVGQNILNFDNYILNNWRRNMGMAVDWSFVNRVIDTRALSVAIQKGNKTVDHSDLYCWQMRFMHHREKGIKASLQWLVKNYGGTYDGSLHHDGLEDARYTKFVFDKMIYEIEI